MKILIESQFLAPIQYFNGLFIYDKIILDDLEIFKKQSYRNRAKIAGPNSVQALIIPLKQGKTHLKTSQVIIDYSTRWQSEHWKSICSAYGKAPFFEHYAHHFAPHFTRRTELLWEFNLELLYTCMRILKIPKEKIILLSENTSDNFIDLRNQVHPKKEISSEDLISLPQPYIQTFMERTGYIPNLSILDLIFNKGSW